MSNRAGDQNPVERAFVEKHASAFQAFRDRASHCPHPDLVSAAFMGVLPGDAAATVKTHIGICPLCSALVEGLASIPDFREHENPVPDMPLPAEIRRQIANEERPRRLWTWSYPQMAATVAAVILVVAALVIVSVRRSTTPAAQTAQSASTNGSEPKPEAFLLTLEPAELKLPLDAIQWRGTEESSSRQYFAELGKALEPYNNRNFADASKALASLSGRYPQAVEPYFYLGVAQLLDSQPAAARASLERARQIATPALAADIDWYLAIVNEREGKASEALALIDGLCGKENDYQKRSCDAASRLKRKAP